MPLSQSDGLGYTDGFDLLARRLCSHCSFCLAHKQLMAAAFTALDSVKCPLRCKSTVSPRTPQRRYSLADILLTTEIVSSLCANPLGNRREDVWYKLPNSLDVLQFSGKTTLLTWESMQRNPLPWETAEAVANKVSMMVTKDSRLMKGLLTGSTILHEIIVLCQYAD